MELMQTATIHIGWLLVIMCLAACETTSAPALSRTASATSVAVQTPWRPNLDKFLPGGARVMDSSEVDTDGDGITELLVIYQQGGIGRGLVIRRGDTERAYT